MENNSQAIELKGIARSLTKLGVQDGQCEDIVNLRLKDGSWRVSDDGKHVYSMDKQYKDLYIHTNSTYHHILGVDPSDNTLYWFANIADDGTFETLAERVAIINNVQGELSIAQTGHLITIAYKDNMRYAIFVTTNKEYRVINVDANGDADSRELYPFGRVHINLDVEAKEFTHTNKDAGTIKVNIDNAGVNWSSSMNFNDSGALLPKEDEEQTHTAAQIWHASMLDVFNQARKENYFTQPLIAIVAVKLYDGSYAYASAPIFLSPKELYSQYKMCYSEGEDIPVEENDTLYYQKNCAYVTDEEIEIKDGGYDKKLQIYKAVKFDANILEKDGVRQYNRLNGVMPLYYSGAYGWNIGVGAEEGSAIRNLNAEEAFGFPQSQALESKVYGSNLLLTLGELSNIINNADVFQGISIFVTPEVNIYKMASDDYKKGKVYYFTDGRRRPYADGASASYTVVGNIMYKPEVRKDEDVIYDLMNSPFYLLRHYTIEELRSMNNTSTVVDLSKLQYEGLLEAITTQDKLPNEAVERKSFKPKFIYNYNQRLHIANYTTEQFHGYPIDLFQLSNHSVKYQTGAYAIGNVLPNMIEQGFQYNRSNKYFANHNSFQDMDYYISEAIRCGTFFAYTRVTIETQQGKSEVVRYIKAYDVISFQKGDFAPFVEELSPFITYPDARAKEMEVRIVYAVGDREIELISNTFALKPHPYLNIAYYFDPSLKPISFNDFNGQRFSIKELESEPDIFPPNEYNNEELFTNGIKVSLTSNPFTFPYESTYQIGNAEIVALMSNAVAVGTGQTGAAPLYVFCKDGIYALMVDSSGEMAYTNARIIARDVCNNAKSVTPIDSGVVFTTDRGLMEIAGNEVVEIGQVVEGDVFDIVDRTYIDVDGILKEDKAKKIMFNSFTKYQLGALPQGLLDNADFLTFLRGAIVNYNHNERELMISNPNKQYTYVMDRYGNWSRRDYKATEYVNNYPTSYRVDGGKLYKVDTDDGVSTNNGMYLLSQVIKLGTIAFKQAYRLVVRGYFETPGVAYGNINGVDVEITGVHIDKLKNGATLKMCYKLQYGQNLWVDTETGNVLSVKIVNAGTKEDVTNTIASPDASVRYSVVKDSNPIGCYIFGSYDGRKWALLGGQEKGGTFTDLGCKISRSDVKFLRLCISGQLSKDSRIDFVEIASEGSVLNAKIR